jgi:hypothetical protein
MTVNDNVGLAQEPQENLSSDGLAALPSEAVRPINNRMTFRQAIDDTPQYSFRLKPDAGVVRRAMGGVTVGNGAEAPARRWATW